MARARPALPTNDPDFKYELYESAVQDPEGDCERFHQMFEELVGRHPTTLKEDFCGTFKISATWVQRQKTRKAIGLDLDLEPIESGLRRRWSKLTPDERKRLKIIQQDVRQPTRPLADLSVGSNFSSFIFKKQEDLQAYFRAAHASLVKDGILVLEIAGGPGFVEPTLDKRPIKRKNGKHWFTYQWQQHGFNPITAEANYSIHFNLGRGKVMKDAFTYDWRIWSVSELRDQLRTAGFVDTAVYWEGTSSKNGLGTGEYHRAEKADNDHAWIAYVVGTKKKALPSE